MSRLIKVTFNSTSGEETTAFATLHKDDTVELPKRMAVRVTTALDAGEGYALVAHQRGSSVPLVHILDTVYRLDTEHATGDGWISRLADALTNPTKDQMQAYGRYYHTLSAACSVGFAGYVAGVQSVNGTVVINAACLLLGAAVLFALGAVLAKGEK